MWRPGRRRRRSADLPTGMPVVALFRHPCGIPLPHTAIISSNRERIAESFGDFVEEQFLAPDPIEQKLKSVDFAAAGSDWLADEERSLSLSRFALRLLPQALSAVEETGLQSFMARHVVEQIEALEVAPLAARLMSAFVEDQRHQRIFDEILIGLDRLLQDEQTQEAVREKIRGELPSLFNLFRADAYVLRRLITLISNFIHEAQSDPDHALRRDFDRFVQDFVDKLGSSPEYADRAETLKRELLARPEIRALAEDLWLSVRRFLEKDARSGNSILEYGYALNSSSINWLCRGQGICRLGFLSRGADRDRRLAASTSGTAVRAIPMFGD